MRTQSLSSRLKKMKQKYSRILQMMQTKTRKKSKEQIMIRNSEEKFSQRGIRGEKVTVLSEPLLEFRYDQRVLDPSEGLSLVVHIDANNQCSTKYLLSYYIGM